MTNNQAVQEPIQDLHEVALRSLQRKRDFYGHLVVYAVVNVFLWALWLVIAVASGWTFPWPIFPTLGWGVGIVMHAWDTFLRHEITEEDVLAEMARMNQGGSDAPAAPPSD